MAEKTYNITLTANHQTLTAEYLPLAAESVQYLTAKVVCETEDWTGREIKAMFGQGCTVYEIPVTGGEITAKQQLNLTAGDWCVWLVGNSARDGEVIPRITTNVAHISVAPTGGTEGNPFPTTPPTVEEQLRADMGNLDDLTTEDKSSLVAAINEAAESGTADAVTYTPQTLTEAQQAQARTNIGVEQSDWNQNDSTQPDYVKNRPFYTGNSVETVLVEESTVTFAEKNGLYMAKFPSTFEATVGETYKVSWDGAAYECTCVSFNDIPVIGNISIAGAGSDTGEPFIMGILNGKEIQIITQNTSVSHTFSISGFVAEVVKIDPKYLPENVATKQYVDTAKTEAQQLGLTTATPGKTIKVKTVQDGKPTEWEVADIYEKPASGIPKSDLEQSVQTSLAKADTAISLGLTAATPGQIIKVKTVQDGKPTEWEAVDMPSEGVEWYEVIDMETAENVNDLIISTDKNGRPISGYHALEMVLCFKVPADSTQTSPNGAVWIFPMVNNYLASGLRIIANVSSWKTIARTFNYFYAGSNRAISIHDVGGNIFDGSYNNVFDGVRLYVHNSGDHLPTGTKVRCLVLSKGWTA